MAPRPANSSHATNSGQVELASPEKSAGFRFRPSLASALDRCWHKADAPADWGLSRGQFQAALERSAAHRFGSTPASEKTVEAYLETLNLRDLALACACSAGNPEAWDFFVAQFRPELYRAARAIAGNANARELADSLYADLYGLRESEGKRKSLFEYFHGRSKLSTWLRAVLSQRHVDEIRRTNRNEPLENESGDEHHEVATKAQTSQQSAAPDPERAAHLAALQAAMTAALGALEARDRLRLACYYADERTLAEIGRLLGEHEATVSRKLERTRRDVRKLVEAALRGEKKWTEAQVLRCLEHARGEWPFDLTEALRSTGAGPAQAAQPKAAPAQD